MAYALIALLGLALIFTVLLVRRRGGMEPWRIAVALLLFVATAVVEDFVHELRSFPNWSNTDFNGLFIVH